MMYGLEQWLPAETLEQILEDGAKTMPTDEVHCGSPNLVSPAWTPNHMKAEAAVALAPCPSLGGTLQPLTSLKSGLN